MTAITVFSKLPTRQLTSGFMEQGFYGLSKLPTRQLTTPVYYLCTANISKLPTRQLTAFHARYRRS